MSALTFGFTLVGGFLIGWATHGFWNVRFDKALGVDIEGEARPESSPLDTCTCGHNREHHIYEEHACRPGFICPLRCEKFTPSLFGRKQHEPKAQDGDLWDDLMPRSPW